VTKFRILGPLELENADGPVVLGGQKQRALLGLLLIHAGEVVSTDRLVDQLWGEHPPRTASTSLQNFVSGLRKLLPPGALETKPPGYVLRPADGELDLARFERLVEEAKRQAEPDRRAALLREALALWRGPPLADLAFETFAQDEIRRLDELRLEALDERLDADLQRGLGGELVAELERLVAASPLRERLRGMLMLALYRAGRQAEALQAYLDARQALVEELGIEPSPQLQRLYRSLLRQESELEPARAVRRGDELADVGAALLRGRLVLVVGSTVAGAPGAGSDPVAPRELAAHLARSFECPPEQSRDLARVAEYVTLTHGVGPLYDELHAVFGRELEPGPLHHGLARLAGGLRERDASRPLIVTSCFDDRLEQAFRSGGEGADVVSYLALGRHYGKFLHSKPDGTSILVEVPNAYTDLSLDDRTVVLKIHGGVDRGPAREWESFVVSEDDHIDYLAQADLTAFLPVALAARLRRSHFLFLGYPLSDWHLRVFLHRVWGREQVGYRSWAVVPAVDGVERELWRQRGVEVFELPPEELIAGLIDRAGSEPAP
jgi:DNA-binding SARP family transcriptional activator